jgi:hypothetical protein
MAYDELLADRMRRCFAGVPGASEKRMFGGLCFLVGGNMACRAQGERYTVPPFITKSTSPKRVTSSRGLPVTAIMSAKAPDLSVPTSPDIPMRSAA